MFQTHQSLVIRIPYNKVNNSPIDVDKCYHFLYSLLQLDLNLIANRKKLINTFVRKVMLSDEEIKILFYPLNKPGVFNESNKNLKEQEDNSDTSSSSITVSPPTILTKKSFFEKAFFLHKKQYAVFLAQKRTAYRLTKIEFLQNGQI